MLSIERTHVAVVTCCAAPPALDALAVAPEAHNCRVAPDEVLVVAPPSRVAETARRAAERLAATDPTALVLDQSDGWSAFTLRGDEATSVFAQLSVLPLPSARPAFVQGAVAGGSAKVVLLNDAIHVLVPSTLRDHVASRLNDVCAGRVSVPDTETAFTNEALTTSDQNAAAPSALR